MKILKKNLNLKLDYDTNDFSLYNYYLKKNLTNKKLYKYLFKLHSDYLIDVDESIKFNTLTNDLISIYFTRLNSNLIKYVK